MAQTRPVPDTSPASAFVRALRRDDGGIAVLALFAFVAMLLVAGLAVDMMRLEHERVRTQNASDRAVLAATMLRQNVSGATPAQLVDLHLRAEGLDGNVQERVTVTETGVSRTVSAIPAAVMPTLFGRLLGVDTLTLATPARAVEALGRIDFEIVMVLDVSGSMALNNRIENMRTAAGVFIDAVLAGSEPGQTAISIVPYSTDVRLPGAVMNRLTNLAAADNLRTYEIDANGYPILDSAGHVQWHRDDSCLDFAAWDEARERIANSRFQPWKRRFCSGWSNTEFDLPMVRPMLSDAAQLRQYIDNIGPVWGTSIDLGVRAGAMLFDPSLRPAIADMIATGQIAPEFEGRPFDWDRPDTVRAMVLMTDGENCCYHADHPATRYPDADTQDAATVAACAGLRDLGVTIYAVAFEAPERGAEVMRACASSPGHFFNASAEGVVDAFRAIGSHIQYQSLRLTR